MTNDPSEPDFDFEFHSELDHPADHLRDLAERRLRELAAGHTDLIGANVSLEIPAENRTTTFVYRARVAAFVRPENLAADKQADSAEAALKAALDAIERQVREKRDKLREPWKQPGADRDNP